MICKGLYIRLLLVSFLILFLQIGINSSGRIEETISKEISQENLHSIIIELCMIGPRQGGTPSGDSASIYLNNKFKQYGISSGIITDPPKLCHIDNNWNLRVVSPEEYDFKYEWVYQFSPSAKKTKAELIYISDIEKVRKEKRDLSGKGVLIGQKLVSGRRNYYELLSSIGAKVILTDYPNKPDRFLRGAPIESLERIGKKDIPVFSIAYPEGEYLKELLKKGERVEIEFSADIEIKMGSPKTVIGKIEGRDKEKYYILIAHGDSDGGGPGADDNASGVAVVLEIARIFQKFIKERILPRPNYSMKFIIPGSEIYSTKEYIERNKDSLGNILGVINFDQCAAGAKRDCIYMEPNDAPVNEKILRNFEKVASDYSGIDGYWEEWTTNPGLGGTDNYAFLPPRYHGSMRSPSFSIPAIVLFSCAYGNPTYVEQTKGWESPDWKGGRKIEIDFAEYYHSSGDTPENTIEKEPYNVVRIAKLTAIALYRMQFK